MSFSKEYQEYHLTPDGWVEGTFKGDILSTTIEKQIPANRVLTIRCYDETSSVYSKPNFYDQEVWKCEDVILINKLKKIYEKPDWFGYRRK